MSNIQAGGAAYKLALQDDLTRNLQESLSEATSLVQGAVRVIDQEIRSIGQSIKGLGREVAAVGAAVGTLGAGATFGFGKAISAAGQFAETVNMFDSVFKEQANSVRAWGEQYATTVGRSRQQLLKFLAESQDTFVPLGFDRQEAADLSKTITKLAIDLGSFKNIDDGEALRRLLGAVVGNTENLRAFGVVANRAQIQAQALSMGFDPKNLTAYQKALAIVELTIAGTADAQGDAARTSDSFVNSVKRLRAAISQLVIEIGEPLREVAAKFVSSVASMIESLAEFLRESPIVTQVAATLAVGMTALGATVTAVGGAIVALGSTIAQAGIALFALDKLGINLTGMFGRLVSAILSVLAAFAGMLARTAIKIGMKAIVAAILSGIAVITKAVVAAGAAMAKALLNPWTLLVAAIMAAAEAAKYYYKQQQKEEEKRGIKLGQERQRIVAQSFRDAGQPVPADLSKTLDVNNARVVSNDPKQGALSNARQSLAEEIRNLKTPVEQFKFRMEGAAALLERTTINREQFEKFAAQERKRFRQSDPQIQARQSLAEQLKTPAEKLRESIAQARNLFGEDTEMFSRAVRAAITEFRSLDPATQLANQLLTPTEQFRRSVENARRLFGEDTKNFSRAVAAAREQFEATDPVEQLKRELMTPAEIFRDTVAQYRELLSGQPELLRRATEQARQQFDAAQQQTPEARIRQQLVGDTQKAAAQIAEAVQLFRGGSLSRQEAADFAAKVRDEVLGENPATNQIRQFATRSAAVAANIGAFAPQFDNTASEEKAYRRKSLKFQQATAKELKKIRQQKPVFLP